MLQSQVHRRPRDRNAVGSQLDAAVPKNVVEEAFASRAIDEPIKHACTSLWPEAASSTIATPCLLPDPYLFVSSQCVFPSERLAPEYMGTPRRSQHSQSGNRE
jgi:hypothetical protein